jgi:hypothetical protein
MPTGKDVHLGLLVEKHGNTWDVAQASVWRKCQCTKYTNPCHLDTKPP